MKKIVSMLLCLGMLFSALSGCASQPSAASAAPASAAGTAASSGSEPVKITWAVFNTDNYTDAFWQHIIDAFEKDNPGIKIEKVLMTGDSRPQWLKTQLAGGNLPDVNVDPVELAKQDGVYAEVPASLLSRYDDSAIATFGGKHNLVPAFKQLRSQVYYNKDLFTKAGVSSPTTWDQFISTIKTLKAKGITPFITAGPSDVWATGFGYWQGVVNAELEAKYPNFNQDLLDGKVKWDDPIVVSALKTWQKWYADGYFDKGSMSYSYTQCSAEFSNGKAAMMFDGAWTAPTLDKKKITNIGTFVCPTPSGVKNYCTMPQYWGVSNTCKNKDAAFKFCDYVLGGNTEIYKYYLAGDGNASVTKTPVTYDMGPVQTQFVKNLEDHKLVPEITKVVGDSALPNGFEDYLNKSLQTILVGSDVSKTLGDWNTEMENLKS